MSAPTRTRLAAAIREASGEARDPVLAADFARRAETGEFDDYADVHVCGPTAALHIAADLGMTTIVNRLANGDFDGTTEESEEWARQQTDPRIIRAMQALNIGPKRERDQ